MRSAERAGAISLRCALKQIFHSRVIVTGDLAQHDRGFDDNGLKNFMHLLEAHGSDRIGFVEFGKQDIERHPAVKEVLSIYGEED